MIIVAILCHQLGTLPEVCVEEIVPQSPIARLAGKIDAPLPMADMDVLECRVVAERIAAKWKSEHPIYRTWRLQGAHCAPHYVPKA